MDIEGNKQPDLIALCTVMLVLATVALCLRCWSVVVIPTHKFGFDDFFAILTLPFIIAESALIYWWISLGLGRHARALPATDVQQGPKIIFAAAFLYDACISLPKFSALFFYYRVFEKTSRWFSVALKVVGGMNAAWLIAAWFSTIFQCVPVEKAWSTIEGGHCFSQTSWFLGTAVPSMIIDLLILILPLPRLWRLHVSPSRKLLLTGVFVCGYCVIVVSIGRLVTLAQAGASLEEDLTWSTITYIEWVQCEGPVSLTSVCLPTIFALGKRMHQHGPRSIFRSGSIQTEIPLAPCSVDAKGNLAKKDVYFQDVEGMNDSEIDPEAFRLSGTTSRSLLNQD